MRWVHISRMDYEDEVKWEGWKWWDQSVPNSYLISEHHQICFLKRTIINSLS